MNERWLPIPEFPTHEVSNLGRVKEGDRFLKPDGYRVRIGHNGVYARLNIKSLVHQLFPDVREAELNQSGEIWKPVPDWNGLYEVSNHYRVRSLGRTAIDGRIINAKILSVSKNNGYLVVYLCRPGERSKPRKFYIEAAVETLFGIRSVIIDDMSEPGEEWREIPGYEGLYEVSNIGRVRSTGWYVNGVKKRYIRPRLRVVGCWNSGYSKVDLAVNSKIKTMSIHRLVAMAFIPNPDNLPVVHHKDENRLNNRVENLEWVTGEKNIQDWFDRRRVVISTDTIERIAEAIAAGKSPAEILTSLPRRRKRTKNGLGV